MPSTCSFCSGCSSSPPSQGSQSRRLFTPSSSGATKAVRASCGDRSPPIYGTGAVMLTIVAARFSDLSTPAMFLVSALIGSAVELATGWLMEILFGAVAWDYSHLPGSFGRSLNLGFTLLWGALGLAWTHCAMPLIYRISQRVDWKSTAVRILSAVGTAFMVFNIAVTLQVLARESARADDLPPANSIERCIDEHFPSSWVQKRFENMSINGLRSR
ncbi:MULTISPECIES: putative ABC transporter permease [Eggerthella]|nr:putative ABC transporter permease [Eggerthella lenta]